MKNGPRDRGALLAAGEEMAHDRPPLGPGCLAAQEAQEEVGLRVVPAVHSQEARPGSAALRAGSADSPSSMLFSWFFSWTRKRELSACHERLASGTLFFRSRTTEIAMAKKIPSLYGLALTNLMEAHGWTAKALAAAAGVAASTISAYTTGDNGLTREGLEELAKVMGLGAEDVEQAVLGASLVLPPPPAAWSPVDPT